MKTATIQTMIEPGPRPLTLAQKICAIMADCKTLEKEGLNIDQNYRYLKESTVADHVRPLLAKHGVMVFSTIEQYDRIEAGTTRQGRSWWLSRIKVRFVLVNADNPLDTLESIQYSEGLDTQDKGLFKASTNCAKYFFIRLLCLGADEDVERDAAGEGFHDRVDPGALAPRIKSRASGREGGPPPPPAKPDPALYNIKHAPDPSKLAEWLEDKGAELDPDLNVFIRKEGAIGGKIELFRVRHHTDPAPTLPPSPAEASETHERASDTEIVDKSTGEVVEESALAAEARARLERLKSLTNNGGK